MPELPEVETVRRGIEPHVVGRRIEAVRIYDARLRWPVPRQLPKLLAGQRIAGTSRRGKYLLLHLDGGDRVLLHLGMTGRIYVLDRGHPRLKHDHVDFELSGRTVLRFHDPRRFGAVLLWKSGDAEHKLLRGMGPEPFAEEFSGDYLYKLSRGRGAPLKNFVMDGRVVVGAGNIYATEALFRAGLRPGRAAGGVSRARYAALAGKIREVLAEAIEQGGTTLRDFRGSHGEQGMFQTRLYVYGRAGEACLDCGTAVRRVVIGQRSSFYCPKCQR
ncbi:MAG TPA: bifunctional DNA-formamidopyrimidine glycosylase/DNA-(apurinic or apyrimidinic site) lyase [Solimonas sp.]|nr:bifunctional DNA-formamidopyrimidine glycosylase/DNA-(apurinic or apyrimidinic site) lyase [Solimonas sp.]